jgi:hypothetical protein
MYRETSDSKVINPAVRDRDFADMRDLMIEYATSIDFELDYQQLLKESASIRDLFRLPQGAGFIYKVNNVSTGFIALRKLAPDYAWICKFYLRPQRTSMQGEKNLLDVAEEWAVQAGCKKIRSEIGGIHPSLHKLIRSRGYGERTFRDESNGLLQVIVEKKLTAVPEYSII